MFDDQEQPKAPEKAKDIFADVDKSEDQPNAASMQTPNLSKPPALQPKSRFDQPSESEEDAVEMKQGGGNKLVIVAVIIVVLVVVLLAVLAGLWFVRKGSSIAPSDQQVEVQQNDADVSDASPTVPVEETQEPEEPIQEDTDGDGLLDSEEAQLQTSINLADTDQDGLTDAEEVRVWNTDPLNPDTDGDSFLDGEEVKNGYDPNVDGGILLNLDLQQ